MSETFFDAYRAELLVSVRKAPAGEYWLHPGETPEAFVERACARLIPEMQRARGVHTVNLTRKTTARVCRRLGIPHNQKAMSARIAADIDAESTSPRDFVITNHGSIVTFLPLTDAARAHCAERFPDDAPRFGNAYGVDTRHAGDIVADLNAEGFDFVY